MKEPKIQPIILILLLFLSVPLFAKTYTLSELQSTTVLHNISLLQQREALVRSALDVKDSQASYWPKIELSFNATWMENPPIGPIIMSSDEISSLFSWPSGTAPLPSGAYVTLYEGMEQTLYDINLSLTQPLFTWGKIPSSVRLYQAIEEAKRHQLSYSIQKIGIELGSYVSSVYHLSNIISYVEEQRSLSHGLIAQLQQLQQSGMALSLEVSEAHIELQKIELALLEASYRQQEALLEINKITNLNLTTDTILYEYDEKSIRSLIQEPLSVLTAKALSEDQPLILAQIAATKAAKEAHQIAQSSMYGKPDIALVVGLGYSGPRFPLIEKDWYRKNDYSFSVSIGMKTTLWDGGKKLYDTLSAQSQVQSESLSMQEIRQQLSHSIAQEHATCLYLLSRLELQERAIATKRERVLLNKERFSMGYSQKSEVLRSEIDFLSAIIEQERLRLELTLSYLVIRGFVDH